MKRNPISPTGKFFGREHHLHRMHLSRASVQISFTHTAGHNLVPALVVEQRHSLQRGGGAVQNALDLVWPAAA